MKLQIKVGLIILISGFFITTELLGQKSLRIGLLLPDDTYVREIKLAEKIIEETNALLKAGEVPFELIIRTVDGHWGAGSKESVAMVYEDSVSLYLGALDGRNAHLAEQVAAKTHVCYIETRATEPSLSQAYVPWFLRIVPNDDQQAEKLVQKISDAGGGSLFILSRKNSDTHAACRSLLKQAARCHNIRPSGKEWETIGDSYSEIRKYVLLQEADHLALTFWSMDAYNLARDLLELNPGIQIYANLDFVSGYHENISRAEFMRSLQISHPYTYTDYLNDGLLMAIEAIRRFGPEPEHLRTNLPSMIYESGITGVISFDDMGNRVQAVSQR